MIPSIRNLTGLLQRLPRAAAARWNAFMFHRWVARRSAVVRRLAERCQRAEDDADRERKQRAVIRRENDRTLETIRRDHRTEVAELQAELTVSSLESQHLTGLLERMRQQVEADTAIAVRQSQAINSQGGM